jgi:glycine cleavage system H lipoate-binding protein
MPDSRQHPARPDAPESAPNLRCVWMTAGILSYQLCDRKLDCDNCPLDRALRMHFGGKDRPDVTIDSRSPAVPNEEYRFSRTHCWVRRLNSDASVRVGVEPRLASCLLQLRTIVVPVVGERIERGHPFAWIILDGGTVPLRAPVGGTVTAIHRHIVDHPYRLQLDAYPWLIELAIDQTECSHSELLPYAEADRHYQHNQERFRRTLIEAMGLSTHHGVETITFADGGESILPEVARKIGMELYCKLLCEAFG